MRAQGVLSDKRDGNDHNVRGWTRPWDPGGSQRSNLSGPSVTVTCDAMRKGDIKAENYTSTLIRRCEAGKQLNAFISLDGEHGVDQERPRPAERAGQFVLTAVLVPETKGRSLEEIEAALDATTPPVCTVPVHAR